jgi:hypothetical protein
MAKPLDERHRRAAAMLGRGGSQADVADEVGVGRRTIQDWLKREDFAELVRSAAAEQASGSPTIKTMRAVLEEAALTACRPESDEPDWPTRVRAAAALTRAEGFGAPPEPPAPEIEFDDDALDENAPAPTDVGALYERWGGAAVTEKERNLYARTPPWGDG